jgi:hypothetical protein
MFALAGALLLVAAMAGLGAWYHQDRPGMLGQLCRLGLPNFSRPAVVSAGDLGCAILGPKVRVRGTLLTGFEAANFLSVDLGPPPIGGGFTGNTWYTPNQTAPRNLAVDRQLDQRIAGLCQTQLASLDVEGWPTITPGHFGHMGMYAREFFEDRVVAVGPPPKDFVERLRRRFRGDGLTDC